MAEVLTLEMPVDGDIQFGEVEEAGREVRLRPDRNRHFAVVPVHDPDSADLPIFVDIDVMRDMEAHALTDTSVELGGVMLGGQFEDEEGNPFVIVTDSLRAEHYEATKGSFKFTHQTWQKISRQRNEFPQDLQMVGWYHTHPDWGVFLSGMDMFICDNFFNRPLDLALVIDPCRGDRGWFQWIGDTGEKIRRTGGFYLIGSRFRQSEIDYFAYKLKGKLDMAADFRNSGVAGSIGPQPAPVVNITDSRNQGVHNGFLGILAMQFLFLAIISWKLLFSGPAEELNDLKNRVSAVASEAASEQKARILERAFQLSGKDARVVEILSENENLQIQLGDSTAKRKELTRENRGLVEEASSLKRKLADVELELQKTRKETLAAKRSLANLEKSAEQETTPLWKNPLVYLIAAITGLCCCLAGGMVGLVAGRSRDQAPGFDHEETEAFEIRAEESEDYQDGNADNEQKEDPAAD
ncbi:MAG: hypothetical protein VX768_00980 [Planctomycetota bacterium]|nr:hypothetical protein [Planctomycetota bacterium]